MRFTRLGEVLTYDTATPLLDEPFRPKSASMAGILFKPVSAFLSLYRLNQCFIKAPAGI